MNRSFLPPLLRKINLVAHITFSVGWLGAVFGFLILSIAGMTSANAETVRSAYISMNIVGLFAIVPMSFAALITGLVQSLGTEWGLFRYWWVLIKFVLTLAATGLLLLHQFTAVARAAERVAAFLPGEFPTAGRLGLQLVFDASLGICVLVFITVLSVFKPWGQVRSRRPSQATLPASPKLGRSRAVLEILLVGLIVAGLAIIIFVHLANGGISTHLHWRSVVLPTH